MKKVVILAVLILLLAACGSQTGTKTDEKVKEDQIQEQEEETTESNEPEEVEETPSEDESTESGEETGNKETESTDEKQSDNKPSNQSNEVSNNEQKKEESDDHQHLVDLAYQIFDAQKNHDYDFLQSNISKGTKMDKNNSTFYFENVTYPHEQPFLTEEDQGEIEFRFTHENSKDSVTVGFGLINYEEEMSFVVEFEFVRENGNWKMNDMDLNK